MSIVSGSWLARIGLEHLEQKVSHRALARRANAAVLMCVAIRLFKG